MLLLSAKKNLLSPLPFPRKGILINVTNNFNILGTGRIVRRDSVNKQYGRQPSSHCSRVVKIIKNKISSSFTRKVLHKRIPILNWIKNYNINFLISDLLAGLTVGLTAIPQGIAYAVVAGLEPQVYLNGPIN